MASIYQDNYRTSFKEIANESNDSLVVSDSNDYTTFPNKYREGKAVINESSDDTEEDDDDESLNVVPRKYRRRKPQMIESSDESENEEKPSRFLLHSTLIPGHSPDFPVLSDEDIQVSDEENLLKVEKNNPLIYSSVDSYVGLSNNKIVEKNVPLELNKSDAERIMSNINTKSSEQKEHLIEHGAKQSPTKGKIEMIGPTVYRKTDGNNKVEISSQKDEINAEDPLLSSSTELFSNLEDISAQEGLKESVTYNIQQHKTKYSSIVQIDDDSVVQIDDTSFAKSVTSQGALVVGGNTEKVEDVYCIENCDTQESKLQCNEHVEYVSCTSPDVETAKISNSYAKCSEEEDIQIVGIENELSKLKVTDIRAYGEVKKPEITRSRYQLKCEIDNLNKDITKLKLTIRSVDVCHLPDNGMRLQMKLEETISLLKQKERELAALPETSNSEETCQENVIKPGTNRLPVGFGIKAIQTQIKEKALTEETLSDLHGSIKTCPSENVFAEAPLGLRSSVELMPHQKHALAWLLWRETQKPPSGILADDMGLGKTLTMISLILKCKEENETKDKGLEEEFEEDTDKYPCGGTLVVCPASLLLQWEDEIKKHCKKGILNVEIHHGSRREESARSLAKNDIVITTYSIVRTSASKGGKDNSVKRSKLGVLHRIRWRRIILDEAHAVRNHKSQQSEAVCLLMGRRRWALTGTPIHNKELDLYALLKFLRVSPFDDYFVWRRWVDNKNDAGIKRLNTVINAIMLRRTKAILQERGQLDSLPEKTTKEIMVKLDKSEFDVYTKILWFSKTLFAQFLQQRAEKEMPGVPLFSQSVHRRNPDVYNNSLQNHPELAKMFGKMQNMNDIKTHQILVLLLRLRQICVHPGLIQSMLDTEDKQAGGIDDSDEAENEILAKMGTLSLTASGVLEHPRKQHEDLCENHENDTEDENILHVSNPVFDFKRASSKMKAVLDVLEEKILNTSDKAIIVSQWTSMLKILHEHLLNFEVTCDILSGEVPVKNRMDIVNRFNSENGFQILLLSLTAGGVGLNLTGGNHLFLIDLHWNPQLESQAFDRIYRYGQKKPVFIYKFICQETIEERIKLLQDRKLSVASGVLSGTIHKNANKLTLDDLKSLFSM